MGSYRFIFNLYKVILINLSLIICLLVWYILYDYVFINIDVSGVNIKGSIVGVYRFLLSTGLSSILFGFIIYKLFSMVYDISEYNLLECIRQKVIGEFRLSNREASSLINRGVQIYAESPEYGIFCKISYRNGRAVVDRLSSGDKTEMECREISTHDLDVMTNERGVSFYTSEAYDKMVDCGFTVTTE